MSEEEIDSIKILNELIKTLRNDLNNILNNTGVYDDVYLIRLLKDRRAKIKDTKAINSDDTDKIQELINLASNLFTMLQTIIIARYVSQQITLREINNEDWKKDLRQNDDFMNLVILKGKDDIDRLTNYLGDLEIKDDAQKELLNQLLSFSDSEHIIRQSTVLWKIVADNIGIKQFQDLNRIIPDDNELEETLEYKDLKNGDVFKLIRMIPNEERKRLEREWLYLNGYKEALSISDDVICIPKDPEMLIILISLIQKQLEEIRSCSNDKKAIFLDRDEIENLLILNGASDSITIIKNSNNFKVLDFHRNQYRLILLFMIEINNIFPELYLLSDFLNEYKKGKDSLLKKLLIRGQNRNNPEFYSKIFKTCYFLWTKFFEMTKTLENNLDEKELLKLRIEHYKKYGIEILKTNEEQKSIYEEVKKEYIFDNPKNFFESLRTNLFQIDFPEDKRREIESILCDLENIHISKEEVPYTPTKEDVFRTIKAIIQKRKFTNDLIYTVSFNYKDWISASLIGMQNETTSNDFYGRKIYCWNADFTFTLGNQEKKIKIRENRNKCFDSEIIYLLWILDILFDTNCLINYTDELLKYEESGHDNYNSQICEAAKPVYDVLISTTNSPNSILESMEWEERRNNHYNHYGLFPNEESPELPTGSNFLNTSPTHFGDER